ncbi:MAG: epimerase [Legionellales bacterium]|nr:MAG: epimerase [Legionellales bacterium]
MKTVLITGATGMVGSCVLGLLLENEHVGKVISVGRRETGLSHPKLHEILHDNFKDFSNLPDELSGINVCFYCLGVYQNHVSKEAYVEITCEYQKALTDVLQQVSPQLTFVLFSASGADTSEKSTVLFARIKGKAENYLDKTIFPTKYIFRPGYIHPTGHKKPSGLFYILLLPIFSLFFRVMPFLGIEDMALAKVMVSIGISEKELSKVFSNQYIRKISKALGKYIVEPIVNSKK